jgi:zinc transport system ATP-binding protein
MSNIVEVERLTVQFGEHYALKNINLKIAENSFVAVVGPNGAGKTTFFKVLLGLVFPTSGRVTLFNKAPQKISPKKIGYVPQVKTMDRFFPALAIELVLTGLSNGWPWLMKRDLKNKALDALEKVGAKSLAYCSLSKLSGGEIQRICLARGIVRQPELVMLDEPATGIDAIGEQDLYRMLEDYQKSSRATILMITHDWHAATHHADQVLLLNRKQVSFGTPQNVLTEENLRIAFGHVGHKHNLKLLLNSNG